MCLLRRPLLDPPLPQHPRPCVWHQMLLPVPRWLRFIQDICLASVSSLRRAGRITLMYDEFIWGNLRVRSSGCRCVWERNDRQPQSHEGKTSRTQDGILDLYNLQWRLLTNTVNCLHLLFICNRMLRWLPLQMTASAAWLSVPPPCQGTSSLEAPGPTMWVIHQ